MNCKPGDLARVVDCGTYTDRLVEVVRMHGLITKYAALGALWFVKPIGFTPHDCNLTVDGEMLLPDNRLRPIRDPGDDAVDEVIQRIGTPHKETA